MPPLSISRRRFLATAAAVGPTSVLPATLRAAGPLTLTAKERPHRLPGLQGPTPLWSYGDTWPLELRTARGEPFEARLANALAEHTSIHWHGVRVPYAMDGVPYITQPPVLPGDSFVYRFAPPDPGTFFFHPHCDTL